jgi:regulator of replication initiation timing
VVVHTCPNCKKDFYKKSHFVYHVENKKNPCGQDHFSKNQNSFFQQEIPPVSIIDLFNKNIEDECTCKYCDKIFTRADNLQRHLENRCKLKVYYDELEKLKENMKTIVKNNQILETENEKLKNKTGNIEIVQKINGDNNDPQMVNNNSINNGVILNKNVNVRIVQFGSEDIDKLDLIDAMKTYLKSTGGNIASNMLAYINLNKDYPENNNICMTDMSREIVKIHNGEKFIYKKFKNIRDEILDKIVTNTRKIVTKYENDLSLKKSADTKNKIKINDVSLKIIDGVSGEDIVRDEIREKQRELKRKLAKENGEKNNIDDVDFNSDSESEEEIVFTLENQLKIDNLDSKREGMQKKTFENIKDGLYNAKELVDKKKK